MIPLALPDALSPLRNPVFRMLWMTWAAANVCMWMNDMAAAWLMTSLTSSASTIALVQTAATLPVFLLSMPAGVLADLVDRRRMMLVTQGWTVIVAALLAAAAWMNRIDPPLLLALVFANGAALAMRGPAFLAMVPDIVDRPQWHKAFAVTAVASHGARVIGPLLAGMLIAGAGVPAVFLLNAAIAAATGAALLRWRGQTQGNAQASDLPREPLLHALRVGLKYAIHAPRMRMTLLRVLVFYVSAVGMLALLPVLVKNHWHGAAATYTIMFALMGTGATVASFLLPRLQARWKGDALLTAAAMGHAAATANVAAAAGPWLAAPALVVAGAAWLVAGNQLMTSLQFTLPAWVRARGISIYHTVLMGANALGALLWGRWADAAGVRTSLACAAAATVLAAVLVHVTRGAKQRPEDVDPAGFAPPPPPADGAAAGRVLTTIEYRVTPESLTEFMRVMKETRRSRLCSGAFGWRLLRDASDRQRFVEVFSDPSWLEMRRRMLRSVAQDAALRDRRHALHAGPGKPRVRMLLGSRAN